MPKPKQNFSIPLMRLAAQHVHGELFESVRDVVHSMGALQAQDYAMAKWALGVRLPGATHSGVETALDRGELIRIHVLRPTWHIVTAQDLRWMLALTAPHIKTAMRSRHRQLEISNEVGKQAHKLIIKALSKGEHRTREELVKVLEGAGFGMADNRASHFFLLAELDGILCSGASRGKKQTYALQEERVPPSSPMPRDEALYTLARRYFTSHGPATLADFIWWSGLPTADARRALEMAKGELVSETLGQQTEQTKETKETRETYWLSPSVSIPPAIRKSTLLLPAYDEFIISYKDRRAALPAGLQDKVISDNGIFRPVLVVDGQVAGLWMRSTVSPAKGGMAVEAHYFAKPSAALESRVEKAASAYAAFLKS